MRISYRQWNFYVTAHILLDVDLNCCRRPSKKTRWMASARNLHALPDAVWWTTRNRRNSMSAAFHAFPILNRQSVKPGQELYGRSWVYVTGRQAIKPDLTPKVYLKFGMLAPVFAAKITTSPSSPCWGDGIYWDVSRKTIRCVAYFWR